MNRIALINAALFFVFWLVVLWAGADHPPPPRFVALIPLILLAAGLVYWRVPAYLGWMAAGEHGRLLRVAGEGAAAGLLFAALGILLSLLLGSGATGVEKALSSAAAIALWFAVLAAVGAGNALTIYFVNALVRRSLLGL